MTGSFQKSISDICSDTENGSSILLQEYLDALKKYSPSPADLSWSAEQISKISGEMIVLRHIAEWAQSVSGKDIGKAVAGYEKKWKRLPEVHYNNLLRHQVGRKVSLLSHSASGSVFKLLLKMREHGMTVKVLQSVSEPEGEGKLQYNLLKNEGINVELIQDSSIPGYMNRLDYVLLGMDSYDDQCFVNKKGSLDICNVADAANIPVYVLHDSRKYTNKCHVQRDAFEAVPFTPIVTII